MNIFLRLPVKLLNKLTLVTNWTFNFRGLIPSGKDSDTKDYKRIDEVVRDHFQDNFGDVPHINEESVLVALSYFFETSEGDKCLIETGSSAWGFNSTVLFDKCVKWDNNNGGHSFLLTCDIRWNPMLMLRSFVSEFTKMYICDSVIFLNKIRNWEQLDAVNYFVYLDSYDLDFRNPVASGLHGLKEFMACFEYLKKGSVLLIDDTPLNLDFCPEINKNDAELYYSKYGIMPGKGMFVLPILENLPRVKKLYHGYQVCFVWE